MRLLHLVSALVLMCALLAPTAASAQAINYSSNACSLHWGARDTAPYYRDVAVYRDYGIENDQYIDLPITCPVYLEQGAYDIDVTVWTQDNHAGSLNVECTLEVYDLADFANGYSPDRTSSDDSGDGNTLSMSSYINAGEVPVISCTIPRRYWQNNQYNYSAILGYQVELN